jgi:hypothetical protein
MTRESQVLVSSLADQRNHVLDSILEGLSEQDLRRGSGAQGWVPKMLSVKRFERIFGCP